MNEFFQFLDKFLSFFDSIQGAICFVPLYAAWVTLLLPGVWASMLAGFIYGAWIGTIVVFFGASFGAVSAFFIGRIFCRSWMKKRLESSHKINTIISTVSKEGWKLVILTRLSPVFPFSLLNFAYGLSEVSFRDYLIGLIGILPGTILFCGLGSLAGEVASFGEILSGRETGDPSIVNILGLVATLLVVWRVNIAIRRSFQDSSSST